MANALTMYTVHQVFSVINLMFELYKANVANNMGIKISTFGDISRF